VAHARARLSWATFVINASGAFVLAALLVVVNDVLPPTTYVRPLVGTGFCGAWTTFSSIAASTTSWWRTAIPEPVCCTNRQPGCRLFAAYWVLLPDGS